FSWRHAAEELRRLAPRPRGVLRLRRAVPGHRLQLPRLAGAAQRGGSDGGRAVVPRRCQRCVPGALSLVHGLAGTIAGAGAGEVRGTVRSALVDNAAGRFPARGDAGYAALSTIVAVGMKRP